MTTHFTSHKITGKGRGKILGYPTVNLQPPEGFELEDGIYAVWVTVDGLTFRGAMHWGPIPTFDESTKSLEVFFLGLEGQDLSQSDLTRVSVEIRTKIRDIIKFSSVNELTQQIEKDVSAVRKSLQE